MERGQSNHAAAGPEVPKVIGSGCRAVFRARDLSTAQNPLRIVDFVLSNLVNSRIAGPAGARRRSTALKGRLKVAPLI
jgi:hypothetical protein